MAISDWNKAEQPRERLLKYGSTGLSSAELLALIRQYDTVDQKEKEDGKDLDKVQKSEKPQRKKAARSNAKEEKMTSRKKMRTRTR